LVVTVNILTCPVCLLCSCTTADSHRSSCLPVSSIAALTDSIAALSCDCISHDFAVGSPSNGGNRSGPRRQRSQHLHPPRRHPIRRPFHAIHIHKRLFKYTVQRSFEFAFPDEFKHHGHCHARTATGNLPLSPPARSCIRIEDRVY
jgi:hypothetical protein